MSERSTSDQWLSIVEYSRTHAISDMTIRRHIKSGKIPAVLRDGKYYIPAAPVQTQTAQAPYVKKPVTENFQPSSRTVLEPSPTFHPQDFGHIPSHIASSFHDSQKATADTKNLLEFCERAMKSNSMLIQSLEDKFKAREQSFHSELKLKDSEIANLKQQVEDLQVLAKMLERR